MNVCASLFQKDARTIVTALITRNVQHCEPGPIAGTYVDRNEALRVSKSLLQRPNEKLVIR